MDVRAAVAFAPGKPLEVATVQLDGPRAGEVLVEIKATGVCHTDEFILSGADPEGLFPSILGHEGAGVVVEIGAGARHPSLHTRMPQLSVLPFTQNQPVHSHPRNSGPRRDARWDVAIFCPW